jgi:hypothetical protein
MYVIIYMIYIISFIIINDITSLLATHCIWTEGDAVLDVLGVDVQNDGYRNCSVSTTELGQFNLQKSVIHWYCHQITGHRLHQC